MDGRQNQSSEVVNRKILQARFQINACKIPSNSDMRSCKKETSCPVCCLIFDDAVFLYINI